MTSIALKAWLIGWSILALIALAAPGLVALGLFLILPGLILAAAPTVVLYSAVFALIRRFLPHPQGVLLNLGAAAFALLAGWVAAKPWSIMERHAFDRANLPDVLPSSPVKLTGHIRLEGPPPAPRKKRDAGKCDALCAALLATPEVESVTMAAADGSSEAASPVFRLIPRGNDRSPGEYPVTPEAILDGFGQDHSGKQAVAAAWGLRLASQQKLVSEQTPVKPDLTIRIKEDRQRKRTEISISRVEILGRDGNALLRRSRVTGAALVAPLYFEPYGSLENFHIGLARRSLGNAREYPPLKPVAELFRHTSIARPEADPALLTTLLDRLRRASANPSLPREDPDLALAALWFPTIECARPLPSYHAHVLAQVISDERIPLPQNLASACKAYVNPELRGALASRIRNRTTPRETRIKLAHILGEMPLGTFATLSPDEKTILANEELRADAYPLIVRLADQGEAAVPDLLAITHSGLSLTPPHRRIWVMRAVSLAFALLGPKAQAALADLDALVNAGRSPLLNDAGDRRRWYLALARMGKPLDEFKWVNRGNPKSGERDREALRRRMERFDGNKVWNY